MIPGDPIAPPVGKLRELNPRLPLEVFEEMFKPFDKSLVKEKKQGGAKISFVEWYNYVARAHQLLAEFGFSVEIRGMYEFGGHLFIVIRFIDHERGAHFDNIGCAPVSKDKLKGYGGAGPEAFSQGLRRAMALAGMGLDMYLNDADYEHVVDGVERAKPEDSAEPKAAAEKAEDKGAADGDGKADANAPTDEQIQRLRALAEVFKAEKAAAEERGDENNADAWADDLDKYAKMCQKTRTKRTYGLAIREMKAILEQEGVEYDDEGK